MPCQYPPHGLKYAVSSLGFCGGITAGFANKSWHGWYKVSRSHDCMHINTGHTPPWRIYSSDRSYRRGLRGVAKDRIHDGNPLKSYNFYQLDQVVQNLSKMIAKWQKRKI